MLSTRSTGIVFFFVVVVVQLLLILGDGSVVVTAGWRRGDGLPPVL